MHRVRLTTTILIVVLAASACDTTQRPRGVGGDADSAIGDSTYRVRLRSWRRDSAVLDSATHAVNAATLYALYRQALGRDGVTLRLMTEMDCEYLRLTYHYGVVPTKHAVDAMRDTVYRDIGVTDALDYIARHAPAEGMIETGYDVFKPMPLPGPKTIGGTRLDVEFPRPRPQQPVPNGR